VQYAKQQRAIFQREVAEGRYIKAKPRSEKKTSFVVADLWEPYLRDYRNRGGRNEGRQEIAWGHLQPMFEKIRVEDVSTDLLNQYIETRRTADAKAGTINREIASLRAVFHHATRVTPPMVDRMPAFPTRLKESSPRQGFITDEQYAVLARNANSLWLRTLIACWWQIRVNAK
jgi:integrase